ncbi:MAG: phage regulatory CII family protein [Desulfovibrionaceae bacterium]
MNENVTTVTQCAVLKTKKSKEIAEYIGKPYPTLMRELNPFDKSAKLGIDTLLNIIRMTQDKSPLEFMAKELGYTLVEK